MRIERAPDKGGPIYSSVYYLITILKAFAAEAIQLDEIIF